MRAKLSRDRGLSKKFVTTEEIVMDAIASKDFYNISLSGEKENANLRAHKYCSNVFTSQNLPIERVLRKYDVAVRAGNIPFRSGRGSCEFLVKLSDSKLTAIAGPGKQFFQLKQRLRASAPTPNLRHP